MSTFATLSAARRHVATVAVRQRTKQGPWLTRSKGVFGLSATSAQHQHKWFSSSSSPPPPLPSPESPIGTPQAFTKATKKIPRMKETLKASTAKLLNQLEGIVSKDIIKSGKEKKVGPGSRLFHKVEETLRQRKLQRDLESVLKDNPNRIAITTESTNLNERWASTRQQGSSSSEMRLTRNSTSAYHFNRESSSRKDRQRILSERKSILSPVAASGTDTVDDKNGVFGSSLARLKATLDSEDNKNMSSSLDMKGGSSEPMDGAETEAGSASITNDSFSLLSSSTDDNIVDIFGIPSPPPVNDLGNVDRKAYDEYMSLLEKVKETFGLGSSDKKDPKRLKITIEEGKNIFAYLKQIEPVIKYDYPDLEEAMRTGAIDTSKDDISSIQTAFRSRVKKQQELFMRHMAFNENQMKILSKAIIFIAGRCAKEGKSGPLTFLWTKFKESGLLSQDALHTFLYIGSTLTIEKSRLKRSRSMPSVLDVLDNKVVAETYDDDSAAVDETEGTYEHVDEIATFHDFLFKPTEQSIQSRIRLLVSQGKGKEASRLLSNVEDQITVHLRVYTPILGLFLEQGDLESALGVYSRIRSNKSALLDSDTYIQMLSGLAEHGAYKTDAPPIPGAEELGFSAESGPALFDEIADEMQREILDIAPAAAKRLYNSISRGMSDGSTLLKPLNALESLKVDNTPATRAEKVVAALVKISPDGSCPKTGVKLHLKFLTEDQKERLKKGGFDLADERQVSWVPSPGSSKHTARNDSASDDLRKFLDWLDTREGKPYTAIVDGPNVGYYMQNFDDGGFNFSQINFVVKQLVQRGENPLVILPEKYTRDNFSVAVTGKKQFLTPSDKQILRNLTENDMLHVVKSGRLDDFYWILASISNQTVSRNGQNLAVEVGDPLRWPGTRPTLITNDQMRDHTLGLGLGLGSKEPLVFQRWYSTYIMNYNFAAFDGEPDRSVTIGFSPVDSYSREIQCNKNENGASVWHFPLTGGSRFDWFCICLEYNKDSEQ